MNRRFFVKAVSSALGAGMVNTLSRTTGWTAGSARNVRAGSGAPTYMQGNAGQARSIQAGDETVRSGGARIYTLFFATAPSTDDADLEPVSHEELIHRLRRDCEGVEFDVRDLTRSARLQSVLNEMKELQRLGYDGVMVYGWPRDYDVLRTGLPTINIAIVNDFMNNPFPIYAKNRVVPAFLDPWKFSRSPEAIEAMYNDLVGKIKLIKALKKMRGSTLLTVTDSPFVNVMYGDRLKNPPQNYNEIMAGAILETFGVNVIKIGSDEVCENPDIKKLWSERSARANELAKEWIRNAEKMINTLEEEVVKSAKCYLAMRTLMEQYGAVAMAFHIRTLKKDPRPEEQVYPALATSEFQKNGIVAKCQSHLNIVLSEMILQYAYGIPSMLGDFEVDPYNNTSIIQHCEGPWNPWGGNKTVPYIITDHRERRVRGRSQPGVGAASWIFYPADEPVTIWQVDVLRKEILLHTGETIPIYREESLYRNHLWEMM